MAKPERYCHSDFPQLPREGSESPSSPMVAPWPQPTQREVVSTISKYIDELDDLVSRKIEVRPLCLNEAKSMKDTVLTKYF